METTYAPSFLYLLSTSINISRRAVKVLACSTSWPHGFVRKASNFWIKLESYWANLHLKWGKLTYKNHLFGRHPLRSVKSSWFFTSRNSSPLRQKFTKLPYANALRAPGFPLSRRHLRPEYEPSMSQRNNKFTNQFLGGQHWRDIQYTSIEVRWGLEIVCQNSMTKGWQHDSIW